jgi:pyruvate dehydrogenase E2 component (dihydrolipoamide acetyltransferase)
VAEVVVPDLGEFADVPVAELLVAAGDEVSAGQPLVVLESDKSSMEIPAVAAGTLTELRVAVGDVVSAGDVIAIIASDAGSSSPGDEDPAKLEPDVPDTAAGVAVVAEPPAGPPSAAPGGPAPKPTPARTPDGVYAGPAARRLARELGVAIGSVIGSGRGGRITPDDVRAAKEGRATGSAVVGAGQGGLELIPWPQVDFEEFGPARRQKLSRIRRLTRDNLARNWVHIPHVTHHDEADITELEAFRKQLNTEQSDAKVTMVSRLLKACAATLKQFPNVNSSLDGDELVVKHYYHLGFAADTPNGLVVPVVRDVDKKGLVDLAFELAELSAKARGGKLSPGEMRGGTFTISSLGGIGGTGFTPIVNAPEVAILGVVRSKMQPVWDGSAFQPRLMLPLSLSYDHRVIDGAEAARFTAHLASVLADFRRVLL